MQLSSQTSITIDGIIDVRGSRGNSIPKQDVMAIFGGGAGGSILLEGPSVTLTQNAKLIAKGGRGGSGYYSQPPVLDTADPEPGAAGDATFGPGGDGAAAGIAATAGADRTRANFTNGGAGGGGGGLGRLRINTLDMTYTKASTTIEAASTTVGRLRTR